MKTKVALSPRTASVGWRSIPTDAVRGLVCVLLLLIAPTLHADEITRPIQGLFSPERVNDLKELMKSIPEVEMSKVDYDKAEVTFKYDLKTLIPNSNPKKPPKPEEIEKRIDQFLRQPSRGAFALKPESKVDHTKLQSLSLKVGIHECKACRYGVYLAAIKIDGVERATVTSPNVLTVWFEPGKLDRTSVEAAFKKANIAVLP